MARCPFARWRPLPENATQGRIDPTQFILHTAVDAPGETDLYGYFARGDVGVESHFFIQLDGDVIQYMDTTVRADANSTANGRAISVETEDDGRLMSWTPAQMASIFRLGEWVMQVHPRVARRVCPHHDEPGWGYHSMWGAPSPWTPAVGKTCPGAPRILQFKNDIRPWLSAPKDWFDMATQAELAAVVKWELQAALNPLKPWIGVVDGDPSGAVFVFGPGAIRVWIDDWESVKLETGWFQHWQLYNGAPFQPTQAEAEGFYLVNRDELETHLRSRGLLGPDESYGF